MKEKLHQGSKFMAVVKGNAYGHGLLEVAQEIKNDVDYLAVYDFLDALFLREKNIKTPILLLGRIFEENIAKALENNIEITITTFNLLEDIAKISQEKRPQIHLCVDTGIGRDGFNESDIENVLKIVTENEISVKGLYMHFSAADDEESDDYSQKQLQNFEKWQKSFNDLGIYPITHTSASGGIMMSSFGRKFDMARCGTSIYGLWPSNDIYRRFKDKITLNPALCFKTKIVEVKSMPKGSFIGYNQTYQLQKDSKIAILPVGYFDGVSRHGSNKMHVLINGVKCPQIGRVMMNITVIDVSEVENVKEKDLAIIIGKSEDKIITAEDCANWANTINYDITTRLSAFLKRIYIK